MVPTQTTLHTPLTSSQMIVFVVILGLSILIWVARKWNLTRFFTPESSVDDAPTDDSSAILSFFTAGNSVIGGFSKKINNMNCSIILTAPYADYKTSHGEQYVSDPAIIYSVDMPFNTESHIIGLSKEHSFDRLQLAQFLQSNALKKVELEGDFRDYFDIFIAKDQDLQLRYVLDPDAMAAVVDYCKHNFWEIHHANLFIALTSRDHDDSSVIDNAQHFINQLRPALLPSDPNAPPVKHEAPFGEYDGPPLKCPICEATMTKTNEVHACPNGDGFLVNGADLIRLHNGALGLQESRNQPTEHGPLTCPHCQSAMDAVQYQGGPLTIFACPSCQFRWLDAGIATGLMEEARRGKNIAAVWS